MKEFLLENFWPLLIALMAFAKVVVNLTPSIEDDKVFAILDDIINSVVPKRTKNGDENNA